MTVLCLIYKLAYLWINFQSESYDTVVGFNTSGLQAAKVLWRNCVEQHGFHRLQRAPVAPKYSSSLHRFFIR